MLSVKPTAPVGRPATLYARVQTANKKFVEKEFKRLGFQSEAAYVDAVITKIRAAAPTKRKATKK